jgi:hypothetical protein
MQKNENIDELVKAAKITRRKSKERAARNRKIIGGVQVSPR